MLASFYVPMPTAEPGGIITERVVGVLAVPACAHVLLILAAARARGRTGLAELGLVRPGAADVMLAAAALVFLLSLLFLFSGGMSLLPLRLQEMLGPRVDWRWEASPLLLGPYALMIGYREELFFRGFLISGMRRLGAGAAAAVVASAALFAIGHLYQGPAAALFAALQALLFGWLYVRLRPLHALAWTHAAYNAAALILLSA